MANQDKEFVTQFYSEVAPFYHLIYGDWQETVKRQAQALDRIIKGHWAEGANSVLDVACGIGTQSIGLAALGYEVTASDLTPEAVERARREAKTRNLPIAFSVADMRDAYDHHQQSFDLVIACDNCIPHLSSDQDILKTFQAMFACSRPGGGCLISVRDYDAEDLTGQKLKLYGAREFEGSSYIVFQKWDCFDLHYDLSMYFLEDTGSECVTHVMRSRYYTVGIDRLIELMTQAGFSDVRRIDEAYFQPVVIGTRLR